MDTSSSPTDGKKNMLPLHESFDKKATYLEKISSYNNHQDHTCSRSSSNSPQHWKRSRSCGDSCCNGGDELPTWSASNPQAPGADDSLVASCRNNSFSSSRRPQRRLVALMLLLAAAVYISINSRNSLQRSLDEVTELLRNNAKLKTKLDTAEKGIKMLQREVSAYDIMLQHNEKGETVRSDEEVYFTSQALEKMNQLSEELQESAKRAKNLKEKVQLLSKREALEKFGEGPHRVEVELAFPDHREGPTKFVIELAPLDSMPHSVHFFLEMVSLGLLDGCSFILNALHVLKAAPLPYDGTSAASKARAFTRMGLESVAFKEYSEKFPHDQYTIGFAADGSPSFYINTEDNREIHMGDPCFGKIVEGFDAVKRLENSPTRNGIWFEQRIGIKRATVLSN